MVTDEDLRSQVVAAGVKTDRPIGQLSDGRLITIQSDESVNEAMLTMLRNHIQRLPVLHRRRPVGVLHLSDIVRYETNSSLYLASNIFSRNSVRDLSRLIPEIRAAFIRLVEAGSNAKMIGDAMSSIGRSLMRRLIELAEDELGPAPIPYCFMVHGSLARHEQSVITDQDNALVLHDSFDPQHHDEYFKMLAKKSAMVWMPVATNTVKAALWPPMNNGGSPSRNGDAISMSGLLTPILNGFYTAVFFRSGCCVWRRIFSGKPARYDCNQSAL